MKRIVLLLTAAAAMLVCAKSFGCTNIIVTKGASADGSIMVTYAADSHVLYGELYRTPAADYKPGEMLDIYNWDTYFFGGKIPQVSHTYQTVGNMNEHQLIITETTFGGREELANPKAIVGYGSLIYITLQRAKTAREAIKVIDELLQNYGYVDEGESFSIADKNECWIMELIGKGEKGGGVWVAIRIPDGAICSHANQSRIHHFPLNDPENCLYSPDVISFAREKGWFDGKDEDFSFCDTYNPLDFSGLRACEARVWSAFNMLAGSGFDSEKYLDFAMGYNTENKMPLYVFPDHKISLKELADAMRDHYEGTPMDMTQDVGAGPNHLPYRWRPMSFEVDGQKYMFERAIATQQTGFWYVCQSRSWLPDEIGGVCWFAVDDAATSALTPFYTNITAVPECYRQGNGSMTTYSPTSGFWLFNRVAHFAYLFYDRVQPVLRAEIDKYENDNIRLLAETDAKALKMLEGGNRPQALKMMTEWCSGRAEYLFNKWTEMNNFLLVKYLDGNVKVQNEDGTFKDNGAGKTVPADPEHPAFPERWLKRVVEDHGKTMKKTF